MTKFKKILSQGMEAERLWHQNYEKALKGSCKGFLQAALHNAGVTIEKLKKLDEAISNRPVFANSQVFLRNSIKYLQSPNCSWPSGDLRRLNWLGRSDQVIAELAVLQSNILELFALGVLLCTEKHPESFGPIDDYPKYQEEGRQLKIRREELFKAIENSYSPQDLLLSGFDSQGRCSASFKTTNGEVLLRPGCGQELVSWCISHGIMES